MGQRLNIEIRDGDVTLANSYYHWSAYSGSALCLLREIVHAYYSEESVRMLDIAVNLLQVTGAGVNEDERARINADKSGRFSGIQFKDAVNASSKDDLDGTIESMLGRIEGINRAVAGLRQCSL